MPRPRFTRAARRIERCARRFARLTCATMNAIADLSCCRSVAGLPARRAIAGRGGARLLARIDAHAALNAFMPLEPERGAGGRGGIGSTLAGGRAARSDRRRAGDRSRTISGLKGCPTRRGSKTSDTRRRKPTRRRSARLREQGAVILGKTCMPEHGWIGVCHSPLTGITRNPWNPDHTPGGSTGGGAVAALLGLGVLHLGTDGAGSLRIPAAFTGVFGMKPSYGLVPTYPPSPLNVLAHQGPITRTVADAALMLSVIAQPDARDMTAWNSPAPDFSAGLDAGVRGLRVAFSAAARAERSRSTPRSRRRRARWRALLEEQGAIVEEADPPLDAHARDDPGDVVAGHDHAGRCCAAGAARRDGSRPARARRTRKTLHGCRLCRGLYRTHRTAPGDAGLPSTLRPAADAEHADDRAESRAGNARRTALTATTGPAGRLTPIRST